MTLFFSTSMIILIIIIYILLPPATLRSVGTGQAGEVELRRQTPIQITVRTINLRQRKKVEELLGNS